MPPVLGDIIQHQVRGNKELRDEEARLGDRLEDDAIHPNRGMYDALDGSRNVAVIAEMKRQSPSQGILQAGLKPAERAAEYCLNGAAAISVLTQKCRFDGAIEDLDLAVDAAAGHCVPVLQKDFILESVQIRQARRYGASSVLLMMRILMREEIPSEPFADLYRAAVELGMEPIVEVDDVAQLKAAFTDVTPKIVGVNNRNFESDDLEIDLSTFEELVEEIPSGVVKVAESGMNSVADIERMADAGADAVLIGGALMSGGLKLDEAVQVQKPAKREAARAAA